VRASQDQLTVLHAQTTHSVNGNEQALMELVAIHPGLGRIEESVSSQHDMIRGIAGDLLRFEHTLDENTLALRRLCHCLGFDDCAPPISDRAPRDGSYDSGSNAFSSVDRYLDAGGGLETPGVLGDGRGKPPMQDSQQVQKPESGIQSSPLQLGAQVVYPAPTLTC
jgi:hypothetical protein